MSALPRLAFACLFYCSLFVESAPCLADDSENSVVVHSTRNNDAVSLNSIAATGSRLGLEVRDLPASVSVVSQELIQLRGARTAVEAIESAVGMTGGTSVGSIPNYATRGFSGNDITVMHDGVRQNTASQSARPLDSFLFDRIEVLKGPASLLYGEGAIGGAVNYVSKTPDERYRGEALVSGGEWDSYRLGMGAGGPTGFDNLYFRADASYNSTSGYVDRSDANYEAYAASLRWAPTETTSLTFSGTFLKDDVRSYYGTPVVYDAVVDQNGVHSVRRASSATDRLVNARIVDGTRRSNYNNLDNFAATQNSFWRLVLDTKLSDRWQLRNESYIATQDLQWRNTESTIWNPATQLIDRSSFLLIYRDDFQWGDRLDLIGSHTLAGRANKLLFGVLYDSNDQIRNSGQSNYVTTPTPVSVPLFGFDAGVGPSADFQQTVKVVTNNVAAYIEDVFELTEDLKIVGGLRYEQIDVERRSFLGAPIFTKSYEPTTGRLGVIYTVAPDINVYASFSRAAQPVSQLVSLNSTQADFSLQTGRQWEIGAKGTLWDDRADLTVALYDIEKNDLLTSDIINGVRVNSQIGAQVSQGAELSAGLTPLPGWRFDANFAWTWTTEFEDFFENLGTGVISRNGNTPPNIPKYVAGVFLATQQGPYSITGSVRYVGEREANNNNGIQLASYTTVEAAVSRELGNFTATLRGRNLTNEVYEEWATAGGLARRLADPRTAELVLKYSF